MPTVTKHTTNNLVTVSCPVREAQLELTLAEYDLILMFRTDKVKNCIPKGTMIYVKDWLSEDWHKREFIRYNPDSVYGFVCKSMDDEREVTWQCAKLIND